jgi:hypothetical protein
VEAAEREAGETRVAKLEAEVARLQAEVARVAERRIGSDSDSDSGIGGGEAPGDRVIKSLRTGWCTAGA